MNISLELQRSARALDCAVTAFDICDLRRNAYPERMLSYYVIEAVARCLSQPSVLLEVPLRNASDTRDDNHLDALIFDSHTAVLCEFKRAWAPRHWAALAADAGRVKLHAAQFRKRFTLPRARLLGFFASDCWYKAIANAWATGVTHNSWSLPEAFQPMTRGVCTVSELSGRSYDGHFLTWALQELPGNATAGVV